MYGALIGDIAGSRFESENQKSKDFEIFSKYDTYTDDSIMTIAVGKALLESKKSGFKDLGEQLLLHMHEIGRKYPYCGYGGSFYRWIMEGKTEPYNSFGNGAGMRTSCCGWFADSLEQTLDLARQCAAVTHNHPEGIKGAQAISACIYLARTGHSKKEIRAYVNEHFYRLDFTLDEIREDYSFDVTCQGSCPQAIEAFLESDSFEDCIRNAVSIGGDSDTIGAMAGSIAEAFYGISEEFIKKADTYFDEYLLSLIHEIREAF